MAAIAIWKRFGLEEEYRKLMGAGALSTDGYPTGEGRRVVSATNVFATDPYSLPPGADAQLVALYPKLAELSRESCYISELGLEKMAADIRSRMPHRRSPVSESQNTLVEPFSVGSPVARRQMEDTKPSPALDTFSYKPNSYLDTDRNRDNNARSGYLVHESVDRLAPKLNCGPISNGNIFDGDSCRSRVFGYGTTGNPPNPRFANEQNDNFNFQKEFLSAFQPGVESKNDYEMIETPVIDKGVKKANPYNAGTLVSPFPWEQSLDAQRSGARRYTPRARIPEASEQRYPSYISRGASHISSVPNSRQFNRVDEALNLFDSSRPPRDFSARSPIRSIMRDSEHSYGYKNSKSSPTTLYHNFL
ncbi:hypothetical protein X943_002213 [Babesia divergens]|uniref:Uncharacterized protein n=1 Tax=Babesia divergens TaxID=32595 RepID=A0AAD9LE44_BABDI|nr:hypothetical protein X943_002213 [Babesia divergens]